MTSPDSGPPEEWLWHLYRAGQWERLESAAADCLARDPDEREGHFFRAWALLKLDRKREMGPHVEFLLGQDPENIEHLRLAALWHSNDGRHEQASECLVTAIRADPEDAFLWHLAAVVETRRHRFDIARQAIQRARELDPDDADIAHLHITLHSMERTGAKAAWETVREHEKALELDPENDLLIASMGDLFLDELEMPERAEELYRRALAIDPRNRSHRKSLWRAMQARHLLFRTLRIPFSALTFGCYLAQGLRAEPWRVVWLVVAFKLVGACLIWWVMSMAVFGPPALMVEWLVLADIERASRAADKVGRWWLDFHHLPFFVRLVCCLVLMAAFWWGMFGALGVSAANGFAFIGWFFVIHLVVMTIRVGWRKLSARLASRRTRRDAAVPPPLPKAESLGETAL